MIATTSANPCEKATSTRMALSCFGTGKRKLPSCCGRAFGNWTITSAGRFQCASRNSANQLEAHFAVSPPSPRRTASLSRPTTRTRSSRFGRILSLRVPEYKLPNWEHLLIHRESWWPLPPSLFGLRRTSRTSRGKPGFAQAAWGDGQNPVVKKNLLCRT